MVPSTPVCGNPNTLPSAYVSGGFNGNKQESRFWLLFLSSGAKSPHSKRNRVRRLKKAELGKGFKAECFQSLYSANNKPDPATAQRRISTSLRDIFNIVTAILEIIRSQNFPKLVEIIFLKCMF